MKELSNKEKSDRIAFEFLRELLFPIIVLMGVIILSVYLIHRTDNECYVTFFSIIIYLATFFWLIHLIYTLLYKDKIFSKPISNADPRWFQCYSRAIDKLSSLTGKKSKLINDVPLSKGPLSIQDLKHNPSTIIEWDKYPDELRCALKNCWTMETMHLKALRLAAPLVCLMSSNIVYTSPNYTKIIEFLKEELGINIDNTQFSDECRLLLDIIKAPQKYKEEKYKRKLDYYKQIKLILSCLD